MTEDELRAIVRSVVSQRVASAAEGPPIPLASDCRAHPSHGRLPVLPGVEAGGPCIIEPHVPCNRCGYCQSFGH